MKFVIMEDLEPVTEEYANKQLQKWLKSKKERNSANAHPAGQRESYHP